MDLSEVFDDELYRTESAKVFVLKTLREAIRKGLLKGGDPLRQGVIAEQLKVSPTPVREALRQLEAEGLVTVYPHRGAFVSSLSSSEARDIFNIRWFLEFGALGLALPNLTDLDLMKAELALKAADSENDVDRWSEQNQEFHFALYRPSKNPRLIRLIEDMHLNVNRYLRIYLSLMNFQEISQAEHYRLLEACRKKNLDEAESVLKEHLFSACEHLTRFLEREN